LTFLQSGADLIINNLLTIKNYTPGQNGITLRELSTISTAAPPTFRNIVGDFQPLDTDLVEAGVQIGYDDLGNVIQDRESPGVRSDLLNGSGNNDQMNSGALRDRLTALGGSDILTGGSDGDVLIGQDGNDQLFADEFVNVSGLVSFENFGGTVGTGTPGDFLTGGINDDMLVSGADDLDAEERIARHMTCCSFGRQRGASKKYTSLSRALTISTNRKHLASGHLLNPLAR
jgi:Ca2+-binding RTX toxin-like protein